jgi:hypothetical protein
VIISKIRKKTGLPIATLWGFGYALTAKIDIPEGPPPPPRLPLGKRPALSSFGYPNENTRWSPSDDEDHRTLTLNGSILKVIADEMGRTECAVRDRIKHLQLRGAIQ